jgi:putative spermidine/putrescine transport system ATP-binding protein
MTGLRLEGIAKRYGAVTAVEDIDLEIPHGQFVCLLGPSGCGKTTLLRLIAGLEAPSEGRIVVDNQDVTGQPAHERGFGMVFQSLALFPHLTVAENIGYSLRIRGQDKAAWSRRADELLELVRLPGVSGRNISQLSGGQRQRVAIARALAIDPKLFLLDEPLSALDAKLREAMQVELRQLQRRLGITTIVVTHDQREAMTMADIVVVMDHGHMRQVGRPLDIYRSPATTFVADFIGNSNLLKASIAGNGEVHLGSSTLRVPRLPDGATDGDAVTLSVRPEEVHVLPADSAGNNRIPGNVGFIRDVGASVEITVECGDLSVLAIMTPKDRPNVEVGSPVQVEIPSAACVVLAS